MTTKSKKPRVEKVKDDFYKVFVNAPPEGGKANKEVIKRLAQEFNVSLSNVEILSGHCTKNKIVSITQNLEKKEDSDE